MVTAERQTIVTAGVWVGMRADDTELPPQLRGKPACVRVDMRAVDASRRVALRGGQVQALTVSLRDTL
jgi:hypothetical protein